MKPLSKVIIVISFLLFTATCLLSTANAAVPHLINYQGRLTDSSGVPLNGSYQLTFRIYDAETAGNMLWEETHAGVVIQKGVFSLLLGSVTDLSLPFDKSYWLEIKVANEVMSPRQRIASSAYAMRAEEADHAIHADNANTVSNVEVSTTPSPNKILPLDSSSKIPSSALGLKAYDSGWFAISGNSSYVKTHNLGTTKLLCVIYGASDGNGTNGCIIGGSIRENQGQKQGVTIGLTNSNAVTLYTGVTQIGVYLGVNQNIPATYARIIILALE